MGGEGEKGGEGRPPDGDGRRGLNRPFEALERLRGKVPARRGAPGGDPQQQAPAEPPEGQGEAAEPAARADPAEAEAEFDRALADLGVEPLPADTRGAAPKAAPSTGRGRNGTDPPRRARACRPDEDGEDGEDGELDPGVGDVLRRVRAVERRRRGGAPPLDSPRLDLHGFSVEHALAELRRFVELHRAAGQLRLRVVTGRGRHSADGRPALRDAVEDWLDASPAVALSRRATPAEGGAGLLLVTLEGPSGSAPGRS